MEEANPLPPVLSSGDDFVDKITGSVAEGEEIPEDFRNLLHTELNSSRLENDVGEARVTGWVFWSRQDDRIYTVPPSVSNRGSLLRSCPNPCKRVIENGLRSPICFMSAKLKMAEYGGLEHDPDYFSVHFKDYMDEKLERNRLEITAKPPGYKDFSFFEERHWKGIKWVFWSKKSQQDDSRKRRRSDDDSAIREVRQNIRCALEKMILYPCLDNTLVQFWAPTRTVEGRTKLTTQNQPFALGHTYNKGSKKLLSEYRMKIMYEGYNFYVDAQSGEEEHGVPGRVYLHKLPECTPDVKYYSLKEYPQRDLALSNSIGRSWALPVFERSSQTCIGVLEILGLTFSACDPAVWHEKSFLGHLCDIFQWGLGSTSEHSSLTLVGVLELVSIGYKPSVWHGKSFLSNLCGIFQELGLQCFEGYRHCEMQFRDENKALTTAFQELKMVLRSVCEIHELPLAMTWVPCSSCDNLLRGHLRSEGVEFCNPKHGNVKSSDVINFSQVSKWSHLRKRWVAGTALSSPSMLCCWDMTQISLAEYPFVPYARRCKFHGWFTICLRSSYTGEEIYVLEFFLPKRRCPDKSWTSLSLILRTMKEKFETFKLASGQELGEELLFEFIDFKNVKRSHSLKLIQANRISRSLNSVLPSKQSAACVIKPGMTIKAKYENYHIIKFRLSLWPTLVEFQEEVAKRLKLEAGSYRVIYGDEEKEFTCDEDLQACQTMGKTLIVVQLKLKQPITNLNPTN